MFRLTKYLKNYTVPLIAILLLAFGQTMADLNLPNIMSEIVDTGIVDGDTSLL